MDSELPSNIADLLKYYMCEKQIDINQLANKCNISPMKIVNIKNNYRTYSQQLLIRTFPINGTIQNNSANKCTTITIIITVFLKNMLIIHMDFVIFLF